MGKKYTKGKKTHPMKKVMMIALASTLCAASAVYANPSEITQLVAQQAEKVVIEDQQGWLETASVTWEKVQKAVGYKVYYKEAGDLEEGYQLLDDSLIRQYPGYFRADALGLTEGEYIFKVVPVFAEGEADEQAAVTEAISVTAHTREGFAFSKESPMGTGSGGYNDDGSVPENAQIIYITADNVNKVQLDVITDSKGKQTACTGLADILAKRQKGYDQRPLIIRMIGTVKAADISGLNSNGYIQLKGIYNTTFEGVGEDAAANGWGFLIRDAHNVELRNVGIMLFPDDAISLDTDNENIWVHNNDIFYGTAGSDKDQAKGDGSCDVKGFSTYVTVSYNHFWDSGKSSLCGMSDSQEFFVTYHHNWYDHSDSRHPRIRVGTVHIYNNYFDGNAKYGVGVTKGASAFVEANDFRNCKYPMLISRQGSDVATDSKGTFSGEPGGIIKAYNNQITGAARLVYQTEDKKEFDAYLAETRNEQVPEIYQSAEGSNTYNNFDISDKMYSYQPDAPEEVRNNVTTYAGRINGGDLKWNFTEEDDADYSVNAALMTAVRAYDSELISVGGNAGTAVTPDKPENPETPDSGNEGTGDQVIISSQIHNFTEQGTESDYFNISGNLSTSKGSVSYKEMNLTQCLKLESSTAISFSLDKPGVLTLVFNKDFNKKVVIDGEKQTVTNGILTVELEAGRHTITKGDTANLYYMQLEVMGEADDEEDDEQKGAAVSLTGTDKVKAGEKFEVIVGVKGNDSEIYSHDFMITYDKTQLTLVNTVPVEPSFVVATDETEEGLRILMATEDAEIAEEGVVKLTFEAKGAAEETDAVISVSEAQFGVVNDSISSVVTAEAVQKVITVEAGVQTKPIDKSVLFAVIEEAEALSSKAEIGTKPGNYPQSAKEALDEAIRAARETANTSEDQEAIDEAALALQEAVDSFKQSQIQDVPSKDAEDINADGKVDIADLALAAYYYKATAESENWEDAKAADIDEDGQVNIVDLTLVARKILGK